jgi:NAD/NADP transhydrogenase beta subunit
MLELFKKKPSERRRSNTLYLVTIVTFILALRTSEPSAGAIGNQVGAAGMRWRSSSRSPTGPGGYVWIAIAMVIGGRRCGGARH